jgi:phenylalanyl-tRNA synthetase beta chain
MLASESSYRFERGVDPGGLERALDRCAALISATAGGKVLAGRPGSGAVPDKIAVSLRPARLDAVAGTHIEFTEARRILSSLGFEAGGEGTDFTEFLVPTHRPDAALEEDLIEEVIRLYGYDRIPPSIPSSAGFAESAREMPDLLRTARDVMSGAGFYEAVNYSFIDGGLALSLGFAAVPVKVRNPISEDMAVMRTSLIPGLLSNARHNLRRQQRSVRLFEAGRVFVSSESGGLPIERVNVAAVLCGKRGERTWAVTDADFDFFDMKGLVERLAGGLGVPEIEFSSAGLQPCLHPGRGAVVISGGAEAGFLGQLHPGMASSMDIPAKLFLFEIDLAVFTAPRRSDAVYAPYTDFPSVERDIAIVVGMGVSAGELVAAVKGLGIPEVASVSVFDIYTGAQIGGGMKNVALSITCRAPDRTLRDSEVEDMHARITAALSQKFGGALRA